VTTTFRADLVTGFTTMLTAFIAANPTLVKRHFRVRPPSFDTDLPCTYLDLRPEVVEYAAGTQTRSISPSFVVVDRITSNDETMDRLDVVVDALVEFIGHYGGSFGGHITATSVWSRMVIADGSEDDGQSQFAAARFSFPDLAIVEGR
jgi:hypothetical protein